MHKTAHNKTGSQIPSRRNSTASQNAAAECRSTERRWLTRISPLHRRLRWPGCVPNWETSNQRLWRCPGKSGPRRFPTKIVQRRSHGCRRRRDRKSTRLNSSHGYISYAVFCLKKKKQNSLEHGITYESDTIDRHCLFKRVEKT